CARRARMRRISFRWREPTPTDTRLPSTAPCSSLARDNRRNSVRKLLTAVGLFVAVLPIQSSSPPRAPQPLVRIRVVVTTEARAADLSLDTGSIVNMSVRSDDRG